MESSNNNDINSIRIEYAEKLVIQETHQISMEELFAKGKANLARLETMLNKEELRVRNEYLDEDDRERQADEDNFIKKFLAHEEFEAPLDVLAGDLQDFYGGKGQYRPRQHLPFAEDVLVGLPENVICSYKNLPRLGLTVEFEDETLKPIVGECPKSEELIPANFQKGTESVRLGRLGGHDVQSKEPSIVSSQGIFFKEFETHGRLVPLLDQNIFLKVRLDQDLTAVLNDHFKNTPEDQIPTCFPVASALPMLANAEITFGNQIESRNRLDQEAALHGFVPASRLKTNVIASEIQRRQNISKRPPDLTEEKKRQMDRKKQNKIDSRARQKDAARLLSRFP